MKKIGVSILAVTLALFLAVPAMAEFDPYGSVRIGTFWQVYSPRGTNDDAGADRDADLLMELGNYSRFGAKFKTGDLGGRVEFGIRGDALDVYSRLLYGTWDFGGGTLLVGQDYNPYTNISTQAAQSPIKDPFNVGPGRSQYNDLDNGFIGYGALWDSRQPQIRLDTAVGFYVSLIQPEATTPAAAGVIDTDVTMPKVCLGYKIKAAGLCLNPGVAYNMVEYEDAAGDTENVVAILGYLNGKVALGIVDLQWSLHYGQNLGNFGLVGRENASFAQLDADGDVEDSKCMGGYVQVAIPVDSATICLGYGHTQSQNDEHNLGDRTDKQRSGFVNAKLPVADTFFIVPEISIYDGMKDSAGEREDDVTYYGMKLQMDF